MAGGLAIQGRFFLSTFSAHTWLKFRPAPDEGAGSFDQLNFRQMKNLFFLVFLFVCGGALAQSDTTAIDEVYDSEIKLPIEFKNAGTTSNFIIKKAPVFCEMRAPNGMHLKIAMDNGEVFLDDKLIGRNTDIIEWARSFFPWISCADFSKCYFQIKP